MNKETNRIPALKDGMILHLITEKTENPFVFIFNNCCQHVHIKSDNSITLGETWSYLSEDDLKDKIDAIWTTRTSGALVNIMKEIIRDYNIAVEQNELLTPVMYYSKLLWTNIK